MAIQGPWVGSSAVAETGQRWMQSAASVVRVGTPFWISALIGRSKYDFELNIGYNYASNIPWRGYAQAGLIPGGAIGAKNYGNPPGYDLAGFYTNRTQGILQFNGGRPARDFRFRAQDGTEWQFNRGGDVHICTDFGSFNNWLQGKQDQNVGFNLI